MNKAQIELHKALQYLDRGRWESGESSLNKALEAANDLEDSVTFIRAAVCYGDWLMGIREHAKAERWLRAALEKFASSHHSDTDVLVEEIRRAQELLEHRSDKA